MSLGVVLSLKKGDVCTDSVHQREDHKSIACCVEYRTIHCEGLTIISLPTQLLPVNTLAFSLAGQIPQEFILQIFLP